LSIASPLQAQEQGQLNQRNRTIPSKVEKKKEPEVVYPFYNGISISADLFGIGNKILGGDFLSSEIAIDANLKNRFFPIAEIGYGKTDTWNDNGIHYKSKAPYFRIGMNYNILYKKKFKNCLFIGFRYAMSSFNYDIASLAVNDPIYGGVTDNPNLKDNVWGDSQSFDHRGMKGSMQWFELCGGIRAHIWKALYMGWTIRMKYRTSSSMGLYGNPWYVPGYGKYGTNTIGITYTITYKLPY
jgi:hypothetical protein